MTFLIHKITSLKVKMAELTEITKWNTSESYLHKLRYQNEVTKILKT